MLKIVILYILIFLIILTSPLLSESYSGYQLDNRLYWEGGSRIEKGESRVESIPDISNPNEDSLLMDWDLYLPMSYRTQKGGLDEDLESDYLGNVFISPELYLVYSPSDMKAFLIITPLVGYKERKIVEKESSTILDTEMILGFQFWDDLIYLQGGRGFQRLDRYGFLMNSFMNFAEIGIKWKFLNGWMGLEGIGGNWNETNNSLTPAVWNSERHNSHGFAWKGSFGSDAFQWNAFIHRITRRSNFPRKNISFRAGEDFVFHGLEIAIDPKLWNIKLELGGIGLQGFRDEYIGSVFTFNEPKNRSNSILYYGKLSWKYNSFLFDINGLYETKNGWESMKNESRFMGGDGSILLNLYSYQDNSRYEKDRVEAGGVFLGKEFFYNSEWNYRIGIFLNQARSEFGRGNEGILQLGVMQKERNFVFLNFAYAEIDPERLESMFIEELRSPARKKNYIRIFLSSGIQF